MFREERLVTGYALRTVNVFEIKLPR
jgi:hypothetical protein